MERRRPAPALRKAPAAAHPVAIRRRRREGAPSLLSDMLSDLRILPDDLRILPDDRRILPDDLRILPPLALRKPPVMCR
jgi:hypothetical protein